MTHLFFDYACSALDPNLLKDMQKSLQVSQNNCIRFCLQQEKRTRIGDAKFKEIYWLNIIKRFSQCVLSIIYRLINNENPKYFNENLFSC